MRAEAPNSEAHNAEAPATAGCVASRRQSAGLAPAPYTVRPHTLHRVILDIMLSAKVHRALGKPISPKVKNYGMI